MSFRENRNIFSDIAQYLFAILFYQMGQNHEEFAVRYLPAKMFPRHNLQKCLGIFSKTVHRKTLSMRPTRNKKYIMMIMLNAPM